VLRSNVLLLRCPIDSPTEVQHPWKVRSLTSRLAAIAAVIALSTGAWVHCAGWQNTAEARMACCVKNDRCPMHPGDTDRSTTHAMTQAQADGCCASAERSPSTPSSSSHFTPVTFVVVSTLLTAPLTAATQPHDAWRTFVPIFVSAVPRHLLLSVFLV
jgi:hypothetical protein